MVRASKKTELLGGAQVEARYPGEWVGVEVVTVDRNGFWKKGRVVAHSSDQEELGRQFRKFVDAHPGVRIALLYTGPSLPEDTAFVSPWFLE